MSFYKVEILLQPCYTFLHILLVSRLIVSAAQCPCCSRCAAARASSPRHGGHSRCIDTTTTNTTDAGIAHETNAGTTFVDLTSYLHRTAQSP